MTALSPPRPTWEVADLFPAQGEWTEADYLALDTGRLVEFVDGRIEVLPVPTKLHQLIVKRLVRAAENASDEERVIPAPYRFRVVRGRYREPDVVYAGDLAGLGEKFATTCDIAFEVVSEGGEERDYVDKRADYAAAGVREYWVVDPERRSVTRFVLRGGSYEGDPDAATGGVIESVVLEGLRVDVEALFAWPSP